MTNTKQIDNMATKIALRLTQYPTPRNSPDESIIHMTKRIVKEEIRLLLKNGI